MNGQVDWQRGPAPCRSGTHLERGRHREIWLLLSGRTTFSVKRLDLVQVPPFLCVAGVYRVSSYDALPSLRLPFFDGSFFILERWGRWRIEGRYRVNGREVWKDEMCSFQWFVGAVRDR